jgi:2-octaprenyl-6-methoxyphenol hydroxylase
MHEAAAGPWVAVQGSGPVALGSALLMHRQGVPAQRIALHRRTAPLPAALGQRVMALSQGSLQLLDRIAQRPRSGSILRVEVSLRGHPGRTVIRADELGVPALGAVVRYPDLMGVLQTAAGGPAWADAPEETDAGSVPLIIHAEGDPGDQARVRSFGQSALLAEVLAPDAPPDAQGSAHEKFTAQGPLALLPLPESNTWSLVWCDRHDTGQARLALEDQALSEALKRAFGGRLGRLVVQGPRSLVPLTRRVRTQTHTDQALWIGNAAQTLHPVAGQGLNLGLRDAYELAELLGQAWREGQAAHHITARWATRRQADRQLMVGLTDLMASSFTWPAVRPLQSVLLGVLDLLGPARRSLARTLMFGLR